MLGRMPAHRLAPAVHMVFTETFVRRRTYTNTFELHIAICPQLCMPRKLVSRRYVSTAEYDEITLNAYDVIEQIESGNVNLGISGFRICMDGICYVRCNCEINGYILLHAYRTTDSDTTEINKIDAVGRTNAFTSAFRSCVLNVDHAIKLIKLRLLSIRSYCAIVGKVYNNVEYYKSILPRFEPCNHYVGQPRWLIKYVLAARMYVDGMPISEISELLHYDFNREMKLITE